MAKEPEFKIKGIVNSTPSHGRLDMNVITVAGALDGKDVVVHLDARKYYKNREDEFYIMGVFSGDKPAAYTPSIRSGSAGDTVMIPLDSNIKKTDPRKDEAATIVGAVVLNDAAGTWVPNKDSINRDPEQLGKIAAAINGVIQERGLDNLQSKRKTFHTPEPHEVFIDKEMAETKGISEDILEAAREAVKPQAPDGMPQKVEPQGKAAVPQR